MPPFIDLEGQSVHLW